MEAEKIRVLMITSEWPSLEQPNWVPFIVQQVAYIREAGIDVDVFSFRGSKNIINYLNAWLQVQRKLRSQRYDLIHAHFGQSGLIALPKQLPLVVTFHGSDLQGDVSSNGVYTLPGQLLKAVSKFVALVADEVIVVSSSLGQFISQRKSYHVIPCGLDLRLFRPMDRAKVRQQLNLPQNKKLILFGGRPEMPVKRYGLAKQVVHLIRDCDVELVTLSNIPHTQMPLYLNACDVLLLTSLHEGSPTIIKEALACNLQIVSTDVGDVRHRIQGVNGCAVCQDDRPETLAVALSQALSRGERTNGCQAVLDLDEQLLTQKVIQVYQRAIAKGKS